MDRIHLHGTWRMTGFEEYKNMPGHPRDLDRSRDIAIEAEVPGNVELDLSRAGILPADLYYASNIDTIRDYEYHQWWLERDFVTPEWHGNSETDLMFEGLDCFATIWLNDIEIGRTANALIGHRFKIGKYLNPAGETNHIVIRLASPINSVKHLPIEVNANDCMYKFEAMWARKPMHSYGWDIMPRALSAGIWRPVYLEEKRDTELEDMFIDTLSANENSATLVLHGNFRTDKPIRNFRLRVRGVCGDSVFEKEVQMYFVVNDFRIQVDKPKLWWPRGYGKANLYDVTIELTHHGEVVSTMRKNLGIRTIKLLFSELHTKDNPGQFQFKVNGKNIFCRGANHVPADVFHSRDATRIPEIVGLFAEMNCNMLRCWGGNVIESHEFYDICDREGIMVWQDFAMACHHMCLQHPDYLEIMRQECEWIVKELRQHPSIALWCGDNESDICTESGWRMWGDRPRDPNDNLVTRKVIPEVLRLHDPERSYQASSPYVSPASHAAPLEEHNGPAWAYDLLPELHAYPEFCKEAIHALKGIFMGEIGYAGMPSIESVKQFIPSDSLWPWRNQPEWLTHATDTIQLYKTWGRIERMETGVNNFFNFIPDSLEEFCRSTQIVQAEALKYIAEHFRRRKGRTSGVLLWNMVDGWPQFSEAMVDCYFRRKLSFHYVKNSYADFVVTGDDPINGELKLIAINDTLEQQSGIVTVRDVDSNEMIASQEFRIEPNSRDVCGIVPFVKNIQAMYLLDWKLNSGVSGNNHILLGDAPFDYSQYKYWHEKAGLREKYGSNF